MALIGKNTMWKQVSVGGAISDFRTVFQQAGKNRWRIGALSAACTISIFSVMLQEGGQGLPKPPKVTYITTWAPHRTDAQIVASNIENQKVKEAEAAEQAAREERVRQMYKTLGRMSGMDVDAIEAKAKAERAAEQAASVATAK